MIEYANRPEVKQAIKEVWNWLLHSGYIFAVILGVSLAVACSSYFIITDEYAPSRNVFRRALDGDEYEFHSGSAGGYYRGVADHVATATAGDSDAPLSVKAMEGSSSENIHEVISERHRFGIAQEDTLLEQEAKGLLRVVAPLYSERVHVFYNKAKFKEVVDRLSGDTEIDRSKLPTRPFITTEPDVATRTFFAESAVRVRSSRGVTLTLADHMLAAAGLTPKEQKILSIKEAFQSIQKRDGIGVAVFVAAAGFPKLRDVIEHEGAAELSKNVGLASVSPTIVSALNSSNGGNYQFSSFSGLNFYKEFEPTNTLATRAMLICSRDVPGSIVRHVADLVTQADGGASNPERALGEYSFLDRVVKREPDVLLERCETWIFSLGYVVLVTFVLFSVLNKLLSTLIERRYSEKITTVFKDHLASTKRTDGSLGVDRQENAKLINDARQGITKLLPLASRIREDYRDGALSLTHQRQLLDNVYELKSICQRQLSRCMGDRILGGEGVTAADLRELYTSGHVMPEHYRVLRQLLAEESEIGAESGPPEPVERSFLSIVRDICREHVSAYTIESQDSSRHFSVLFDGTWFVRLVATDESFAVVTPLSKEDASRATEAVVREPVSPNVGASEVLLGDVNEVWNLKSLVLASLAAVQEREASA